MVSEVRIVDTSAGLVLTGRGTKETFWDHGNVLRIDLVDGHTGIYICKKSSSCT